MRHSPLVTLALATAFLLPGTLSAFSHYTKQIPVARRVVARSGANSRVQHPQPTVFHGPARRINGRRPQRGPERAPRHQAVRGAVTSRSGGTRRRVLTVVDSRHRLHSQQVQRAQRSVERSGRATNEPASRYLMRAAAPSEPASVVSVIRPTSDRPQLPSVQEAAIDPIVLPALYNDRGRLIVPAPLLGSHEILVRQNEVADQDGLGRVQDDADLDGMRAKGMLVGIPTSDGLHVDERLPSNRRYCRPWAARFLTTLARAHYERFHTPLQVNSAVRTVAFQVRLQRTNGNAAPAEGDTASPHLTGQAVDVAKRGLSLAEIAWLRGYLLPLIQDGRVDVEEEFQQSCFHISVYRRYLPPDSGGQRYAAASRGTATLAAAIR